jgi:hypothetical protein
MSVRPFLLRAIPLLILSLAVMVPGTGAQQTVSIAVNTVLCDDVSCESWQTIDGAEIYAIDANGEVIARCTTNAVAAPEGCGLDVPEGQEYSVVWDTSLIPETHPVAVQPFTMVYAPVHPNVLTMGFAPSVQSAAEERPDPTGNTLEIKVWDCPTGTEYDRDEDFFAYYYDTCTPMTDPVDFTFTDAHGDRSQTTSEAWVTFQDVQQGDVLFTEHLDGFYFDPVVACNDGTTMDEVPTTDGTASIRFEQTRLTITCDWFNIRSIDE